MNAAASAEPAPDPDGNPAAKPTDDQPVDLTEEVLPADHRSGFVAVVGRPNVGKSTLVNALLRQKVAIVSPRPQTTRSRQLGIITEPGYQMVLVDTPGLIKTPRHQLDAYMLRQATEALLDADVVLWLVDASEPPQPDDEELAGRLRGLPGQVVLALNKVDLLRPEEVAGRVAAYRTLLPAAPWLLFSATQAAGVAELERMLVAALPPGPRYYPPDQVTETYLRDIAAEMIREQLLMQLREEVPHAATVVVKEFKERPNGVTYINAEIVVERDSHKKIVIGKKGQQLRQIGAAARASIHELVEAPVYLDLWVRVAPDWRQDARLLHQYGYAEPE